MKNTTGIFVVTTYWFWEAHVRCEWSFWWLWWLWFGRFLWLGERVVSRIATEVWCSWCHFTVVTNTGCWTLNSLQHSTEHLSLHPIVVSESDKNINVVVKFVQTLVLIKWLLRQKTLLRSYCTLIWSQQSTLHWRFCWEKFNTILLTEVR